MRFALKVVGDVFIFLADVEELHQAFDGLVNVSLKSVNVTDLLVALSLLEDVT